jgi:hypothetical protein
MEEYQLVHYWFFNDFFHFEISMVIEWEKENVGKLQEC